MAASAIGSSGSKGYSLSALERKSEDLDRVTLVQIGLANEALRKIIGIVPFEAVAYDLPLLFFLCMMLPQIGVNNFLVGRFYCELEKAEDQEAVKRLWKEYKGPILSQISRV